MINSDISVGSHECCLYRADRSKEAFTFSSSATAHSISTGKHSTSRLFEPISFHFSQRFAVGLMLRYLQPDVASASIESVYTEKSPVYSTAHV